MGQDAAKPFEDARDKIIDWSRKFMSWDEPARKQGPAPKASQLHWADQSQMRKASDDPKLGGAKKKVAPKRKVAPARKRQ